MARFKKRSIILCRNRGPSHNNACMIYSKLCVMHIECIHTLRIGAEMFIDEINSTSGFHRPHIRISRCVAWSSRKNLRLKDCIPKPTPKVDGP